MRLLDKLAQEKFDGDIYRALDYAYRTWGSESTINEEMIMIYKQLTTEERKMACKIIRNLAIERSGKEKVERFERSIRFLGALDLSEEEITGARVNPYKKPFFIFLAAPYLSVIVPLLLYPVVDGSVQKWTEWAQLILIGLTASKLAEYGRKFYLFYRARRALQELDEMES